MKNKANWAEIEWDESIPPPIFHEAGFHGCGGWGHIGHVLWLAQEGTEHPPCIGSKVLCELLGDNQEKNEPLQKPL